MTSLCAWRSGVHKSWARRILVTKFCTVSTKFMGSQYDVFFRVARLTPNFFDMAVIIMKNVGKLGSEIFTFPQRF
jgi:hypothetical protein